jgi:hypothetical protein
MDCIRRPWAPAEQCIVKKVFPAGLKEKIPGVQIGRDRYCVNVGAPPGKKCTQKTINAAYSG